MTETYIEKLATYANSIAFEKLPSQVIDKVKLCIIDSLECCLSYTSDIRLESAYSAILKVDNGGSILIGSDKKASPVDAAYYNTVKGSVTNRNDIHPKSAVHAGAVVFPTVLAIAEDRNINGKKFIESILAGYETMNRFGSFLNGRIGKAWRTTAVFSPIGAAFAASKALCLDETKMASAASIACNSACGFNEWSLSGTGEDVFQNGNGARSGVFSALLAEKGVFGCRTIIEGMFGVASAFNIKQGFSALDGDDEWAILSVLHKPLECCVVAQTPSQCVNSLLIKHPEIRAEIIDRIEIKMDSRLIKHPGCNNTKIENLINAIMSIQFGVANVIINRGLSNLNWMPPYSNEVRNLMNKCILLEENTGEAPLQAKTEIAIYLKDGSFFSNAQRFMPLQKDEIIDRFMSTASNRFGKENAKSLLFDLLHLEDIENMTTITDKLARI
ncbi:MAG: MmgE/PrpD family protein [Sphaerochaetaceae bacterium]|nr:MmgE/PrpD family protein [Sphaerochaetaceae bacterium]